MRKSIIYSRGLIQTSKTKDNHQFNLPVYLIILLLIVVGSCRIQNPGDCPNGEPIETKKKLLLTIDLDGDKSQTKRIDTNEYYITSLDISVYNLDTDDQVASFFWTPEEAEVSYKVPVNIGSRYYIYVVHHGNNGEKDIDYSENTEVTIEIMKIHEVVIHPGAGVVVSVAQDYVEPGKALNIYCWTTEFQDRFDHVFSKPGMLPEGYKVNLINTSFYGNNYQGYLDDALFMQNDLVANDRIDLFLVEAEYALKYTDSEYTLDVIEDIGLTESDLSNMYPYTKDLLINSNGVLKGVSWQACPGVYMYRRSIMRDVIGTDDPDQVQEALNTWDKFDAVAALAKEKGYFMVSGYDDDFRVFSDNMTSKWVIGNKINIDPQIEGWIEQTKLYTERGFNNQGNLWSSEMFAHMGVDGKVMGYFGPGWFVDFVLKPNSKADPDGPDAVGNGSYGDWGLVKGPQGFSWGGTWICGAAGSDNIDLIRQIMIALTVNTDNMKSMAIRFGDFTNNRVAMADIANSDYGYDFLGGQNPIAVFEDSAESLSRSNISPYDQGMTEKIQNAFFDYFDGIVTKEQAWDNFYTEVLKIYPELSR